MSLLSDSDVASCRGVLNQSLPDRGTIQTESFTDNLGGGGTLAWTASGTFDCRVAAISGNEREIADRLAEDASWVVTLPATTPITTDARILSGGRTFNVLAMRAPRSWELSRRVEVNEVV